MTWLTTKIKAGEKFAQKLPTRLKSVHGSALAHAVFKRASLEQTKLRKSNLHREHILSEI